MLADIYFLQSVITAPLLAASSFHAMYQFFVQGGFFMALLLICSVVSVTVIFLRGMALRRADWGELLKDEDEGGWIIPIFALAHEHDPDPAMRPYQEPMSAERREDLIVRAAAGITAIYRYFEPHRRMLADRGSEHSAHRRTKKIGRNDPCSCGSGKKYKHCCGKPTLH